MFLRNPKDLEKSPSFCRNRGTQNIPMGNKCNTMYLLFLCSSLGCGKKSCTELISENIEGAIELARKLQGLEGVDDDDRKFVSNSFSPTYLVPTWLAAIVWDRLKRHYSFKAYLWLFSAAHSVYVRATVNGRGSPTYSVNALRIRWPALIFINFTVPKTSPQERNTY